MNARDWFGVGGRLIGVWLLVEAIQGLAYVLVYQVRLLSLPNQAGLSGLYPLIEAGLGAYLIFGAEHLAGIVYRAKPPRGFDVETRDVESDKEVTSQHDR